MLTPGIDFDDAYEAAKRANTAEAWRALAEAALDKLADVEAHVEELESVPLDIDAVEAARKHIFDYGDMANGRFWLEKALEPFDF